MDTINKETVWHEVLESIKISVSDAIFSTWFAQTHLSEIKKVKGHYVVEIGCPSSFIKNTVESRYYGLIQDSLQETTSSSCDLIFIVKDHPKKEERQTSSVSPLFEKENTKDVIDKNSLSKTKLRSGFTFSNFAVSSSNQMAWAAADAVSKDPGKAYNPLFIWGGVGVGKTHLMNAIGYEIIRNDSDRKIYSCTGEDFTNDIVEGIRNKTTQNFREKYRKLNSLLIDDIQFIAGKDTIQEEFFHTFNTLVSFGSQIILTSDRPPSEISKLEERLRSRFEAGLIVDISPPDFELRCAICQIKSLEKNLSLPMDLIQLIAGNLDSARKIEGFLIRLSSSVNLNKTEINEDTIQTLLGKGEKANNQLIKASPNDIISAVSKYFSIGKRVLLGKSRARPVARPRQILMYLLRTQLSLPLQEIGRIIGGRDHTTVMHAVDKITHLASNDVQIRSDIRGIKNLL